MEAMGRLSQRSDDTLSFLEVEDRFVGLRLTASPWRTVAVRG
jgi:hypothetical protein